MICMPFMKNRLIVACLYLACLANLAVFLFVVEEVVTRYPDNHVGMDPWLLATILAPTVGTLAAPWLLKSQWRWFAAACWGALLALFIVIDVFNLLVEHEKWGSRGLAEWGTPIWRIELH